MQHPCGIRFLINAEPSQDPECNYFTSVLNLRSFALSGALHSFQKKIQNLPFVPLAAEVRGLYHSSLGTGNKSPAQVLLVVHSTAGPCSAQINHPK